MLSIVIYGTGRGDTIFLPFFFLLRTGSSLLLSFVQKYSGEGVEKLVKMFTSRKVENINVTIV